MKRLIVLLLLSYPAFAASYFVSPTGSDSAAGSSGAPWLTCQKAAQTMVAGDTTTVLPGTYINTGQGGSWNGTSDNWACQFANSGTSGNVITMQCQTRGTCIFDGGVTCGAACDYNATNGAREYISTGGHNYITITGFIIQNTGNDGIHDAANTSTNVTVQQCEIRQIGQHKNSLDAPGNGIGEEGVYLNTGNTGWTFDADSFHDIGRTSNSGQTLLHFDHGLYAGGGTLTVSNSIFYNITEGWCMQIDGGSTIHIYGNTFYSTCGPYTNTSEIGAVELWSNNTITSISFQQNIFYSLTNGFGGFALGTFSYTGVGTNLFDYNDIYGPGLSATTIVQGGTPANWTNGTHIISANPVFVNPTSSNFALTLGSAAIGAGANLLSHDYLLNARGNPNDIGAYQYLSSAVPQLVSINGISQQELGGPLPISFIGTAGLSATPPLFVNPSGNFTCPSCTTSGSTNPGNLYSQCVPDGATDNTTQIANEIASLVAGNGGSLIFPAGTCLTGPQTVNNNVVFRGAGRTATTLKLKNSSNASFFKGSLNGYGGTQVNKAASFGSGSSTANTGFGFYDMTVDGNYSNQTGTSHCLVVYADDYILQNVTFQNCLTEGIYADFNGSLPNNLHVLWENVIVHDSHDAAGSGMILAGPTDVQINNCFSHSNTGNGMELAPNAGAILLVNCHFFAPGSPASGFVGGAVNLLVEGGFSSCINCEAEGSNYANVVVLASYFTWNGGLIYGIGGQPTLQVCGLCIGQAAGNTPIPGQVNQSGGVTTLAGGSNVTAHTHFYLNNPQVNFAASNGYSIIDGDMNQANGTAYYTGTPAATDVINLYGQGLTATGAQSTGSWSKDYVNAFSAFTVTGPNGDVYNVNTFSNPGFAQYPNGTSLQGFSGNYSAQTWLFGNNGIQANTTTFGSLATCNSGNEGLIKPITNSSTNTWGATISTTGTDHVLAYCDGTQWTVMGK